MLHASRVVLVNDKNNYHYILEIISYWENTESLIMS